MQGQGVCSARNSTPAAIYLTQNSNKIGSEMKCISRCTLLSVAFALLAATALNPAFAYGEVDRTYQPEGLAGTSCSNLDVQAVVDDGGIYTLFTRPANGGLQDGIVRHRADGSIDKGWGTGGEVSAPYTTQRLLPAADGGLYVIGNVIGSQIWRYQRNGTLDPSYGSGGISDVIYPRGTFVGITAILQSDGSVVTLSYTDSARVFTRTNPRGIRDTGFGLDGSFSIPFTTVPKDIFLYAWSVESDGSLQLAWYRREPDVQLVQLEIRRFRKDLSTADPNFDSGGRLVPRRGVGDWLSPFAKVQADGALLLATADCLGTTTCSEPVVAVRRYNTAGMLDPRFGTNGKTVFQLLGNERDSRNYATPTALWLGPDGKMTVLMRAQWQFGSFGIGSTGILAYRLNTDGTLDASFQNGKGIPNRQDETFLQLDDGRLLQGKSAIDGCAPTKFLTDTPRTAAVIVEYYSQKLDHYFMTAHEHEMDILDRGAPTDWKRTGHVFGAFDIKSPMPGTSPVCRFYGGANGGPNSHFYSAEKFECDILATIEAQTPADKPAWRFEREAFRITEPVDGNCPPNLTPLYRLYNRAGEPGRDRDPNHRYTTDINIHAEMQAQGWVSEGVHMCMPPASRSDRMPF